MAYSEAKARACWIVAQTAPDTEAARRFVTLKGKASTATETGVAANSGAFRSFEIIPGASRRGTAVNGTGPKQIIHEWSLVILYPDTKQDALFDTMESDLNKLRARLENPQFYDFTNTGLQNLRVGATSRVARDGNYYFTVALTATYIGTN